MKEYNYCVQVKENDALRSSFNELTKKTFGFNFIDWYDAGHWGDMYIPYALLDKNKIVSNVSVNIMNFDMGGIQRKYIQLGTVMTDEAYRNKGLNRKILERILREYEGKVDGIYLFGNGRVLDYYPKFGFRKSKEYEYYISCESIKNIPYYKVEKIDMTIEEQPEKLYETIRNYTIDTINENDGMYMHDNIGLYQFWLDTEFGENIYYLPELEIYLCVEIQGEVLYLHQIWGKEEVDITCLAKSFGENIREVVLGYTPVHKDKFSVREYKEEDSTLFILGEGLQCIEREKLKFPIMSHA